jgi:ribosomal protein S18 acetylase RimI-like enzyme
MVITRVDRYSEKIYSAVLKLLPQLNPDVTVPSRKEFSELLESSQSHFFISESDEEITGMATLIEYRIPTGKKFWIEDVVVDQAHRSEGTGKQLVLTALQLAFQLGAKEVRLTSRPGRAEANKLYRKLGFISYETNVYRYLIPGEGIAEI